MFVISSGGATGQPKAFQDSLAQFSYLLYGSTVLNKESSTTKVMAKQSTGFFLEVNKRIYFVTASHAVTNYLKVKANKNEFPESYNVYSHYSEEFNFNTVPAVWMSNSLKIKQGLNYADVFTYEVTDKLNRFPASIVSLPNDRENFITSKKEYGEIRIFGFPAKMNKIQNDIIEIAPPYLFSTKNFKLSENFINQIEEETGIDSVRYEIQIKDSRVSPALGGFSGAPVFIQNKPANRWEFLGILTAINPIRNSIYVVKKDKVIDAINLTE